MAQARWMEMATVPDVVFKTRVRDDTLAGPNPYRWEDVSTERIFAGRRVVVFSLPGAFTPICSGEQCPAFELAYAAICACGVDDIYCISVNDAFVMFQWGQHLGIRQIKLLPDGNGQFTRRMGMLVNKEHLGFGYRSWRYAMIVDDKVIEQLFVESGINDDGSDEDPYLATQPGVVLEYLKNC